MNSIIELKLGACLNMPTKRLHKLLSQVAQDCNRARNGMLRAWVRWREDNPDWKPQQRRIRNGSLKTTTDGKPVMEDLVMSQEFENQMYYVGRELAPKVSSNIVSHCRSEVVSDLKDRMPYTHDGPSRFVWQALLNHERSQPSYSKPVVPMPKANTTLTYDDSQATIRIPLLSKDAGYGITSPLLRFDVRQQSEGRRELIRSIVSGRIKMADSKLVHKRGEWYFQLCFAVEPKGHGLDETRIATLLPCGPLGRRPFMFILPDGHRWYMGDGIPLLAEYERLVKRRKAIRYRSRDGVGRGHGKQGFYRALPDARSFRDMQDRFVKNLVADILRSCLKNNIGMLRPLDPSKPLRANDWLASKGIPFDWTKFIGYLNYKLFANSIAVAMVGKGKSQHWEIVSLTKHREEYPQQWPLKKN